MLRNVFGWLILHKYCTYAQTSAKVFLQLIGKHFGNPSHKLRKICNRSNLKISYSCMPNMKSIISNHNKRILEENVARKKNHTIAETLSKCPIYGRCNVKSIVYTAILTPQKPPSTTTDTSIKQPANNVETQQLSQTPANVTNSTGCWKKVTSQSKIINYKAAKQSLKRDSITTSTHYETEINQMQPKYQNTIGTASFTTINQT